MGYKTIEIEEKWKDVYGFRNAHFMTSNTAGLFLAIETLKSYYEWDDSSEIISTPITFVATNHAVINAGLRLAFAEVDTSLNLSPSSVESCINPNTKAIIFVGIGGNTANYQKIKEIARKHNLKLILDAAHMAGSYLHGKHVGVESDCAVFSFQAVKNMPTADSGMLCFNKNDLDSYARARSWLGITKDTYSRTNSSGVYKWDYDVPVVSNKYHGNSIMAAMALVSIRYLEDDNQHRRKLAKMYESIFSETSCVTPVVHERNHDSTFSSQHLFQIMLPLSIDRNDFIERLNGCGIYPGVHYKSNSFFDPYKHLATHVRDSESYSQRILSLPLHISLTESDVEFIALRVIADAKKILKD